MCIGSHVQDDLLVRFFRRQFAYDSAFIHNHDSITHAQNLGHFRSNHDNCSAIFCQLIDEAINLILRANVDTSRRFIEEDDIGFFAEPSSDQNFLLVTAREELRKLLQRRSLDRKCFDKLANCLSDFLIIYNAARGVFIQVCDVGVEGNILVEHEAISRSILTASFGLWILTFLPLMKTSPESILSAP